MTTGTLCDTNAAPSASLTVTLAFSVNAPKRVEFCTMRHWKLYAPTAAGEVMLKSTVTIAPGATGEASSARFVPQVVFASGFSLPRK
jgi:hypothetical protein